MQIQRILRACVGLALAATGVAAHAVQIAGEDWTPIAADALEDMRGGFTHESGLAVSFGLERVVEANGVVVAHTSLQIPDVGHMTVEQAQQAREVLSSVTIVQIGQDNVVAGVTPGQVLGGTFIQNSLDNQAIRSQTVISATVNSLALLKELEFQRSLAAGVAGAVSPP